VLGFTFALALLAGILFGLVPAAQAARVDLNEPLKEGSTRSTGGARGNLMRRILVVGQWPSRSSRSPAPCSWSRASPAWCAPIPASSPRTSSP
ncbi:MAG: hypothetical protein ACLGI9_12795, partial [Thermoanaerobaculia bacterium]